MITELVNAVRWHMLMRGLTDAEVARRMGVSTGRLANILLGSEDLRLSTIDDLMAALDVRCDMKLVYG